jgi:ribosome-associated toxin RatA of RatAB toxin-antitoxin module
MMRTTIGIDIDAPPELVFHLARDVTRWELLLPHYTRSRAVGRAADGTTICAFVAQRALVPVIGLGLPVAWRSRTWSEPTSRRLRFFHVAGATRGMDVTWTIEPAADGTRIEIAHDFERRLPIPGLGALLGDGLFPAIVDRWFTRHIAGRTLATFKVLAEALAVDGASEPATAPADAGESAVPSATNHPA